jgi:hypothetical protein
MSVSGSDAVVEWSFAIRTSELESSRGSVGSRTSIVDMDDESWTDIGQSSRPFSSFDGILYQGGEGRRGLHSTSIMHDSDIFGACLFLP